jgi:hypothetical protein
MNLMTFLINGFQGPLTKTHRWGLMHLESHYKVDPLLELDNLDVVDGSSKNVDFLDNKSRRMFTMFSTTNSLSKDLNICFLID